jgi:hypothetical protein
VGPGHHGMARPQVPNGGDGLQVWRVTRGRPTRGDPSAWGLGVGLTTLRRKNKLVTKDHKKVQVKEDEMGRACSTNGGEEECI